MDAFNPSHCWILQKAQGWCMNMKVCECIYAHVHPPRTLCRLGLPPALPSPSPARPWQIAWILAACLRNNTSRQVDRGALRSRLLFLSLSLLDVYIQSSRSPSQQWSCIQQGFGVGGAVGERWVVSAPLGNKGHLFNLRRGGSLQPVFGLWVCCYSARLPAAQCIHYTCVGGNLTVSGGSIVDEIIREVTGWWCEIQGFLIISWVIGLYNVWGPLWAYIRSQCWRLIHQNSFIQLTGRQALIR